MTVKVQNFLVPAIGNVEINKTSIDLTVDGLVVDFASDNLSGSEFVAQACYISNTGSETVTIYSLMLGMNVAAVPAGGVNAFNFPALSRDKFLVTGLGQVDIVWMNAPALPSASLMASIMSGQVSSLITNTPSTPVPVNLVSNSMYSLPRDVVETSGPQIIAAGGTTLSYSVVTTNNPALRKIILSGYGGMTLAVAGSEILSLASSGFQAGAVFHAYNFDLTTVASSSNNFNFVLDFENPIPVGTGGNISLSLNTALAAGNISFNAFFV